MSQSDYIIHARLNWLGYYYGLAWLDWMKGLAFCVSGLEGPLQLNGHPRHFNNRHCACPSSIDLVLGVGTARNQQALSRHLYPSESNASGDCRPTIISATSPSSAVASRHTTFAQ
ncbi:hypothetical protein V2G26_004508 [Clonostachys chloroleuca]